MQTVFREVCGKVCKRYALFIAHQQLALSMFQDQSMDSVDFPSCWKQEKYVRPIDYTSVDLYKWCWWISVYSNPWLRAIPLWKMTNVAIMAHIGPQRRWLHRPVRLWPTRLRCKQLRRNQSRWVYRCNLTIVFRCDISQSTKIGPYTVIKLIQLLK